MGSEELRILFVDGSETDVHRLLDHLAPQSFNIVWRRVSEANGLEAALRDEDPDLAIVDCDLPGRRGREAVEQIRELAASVPVIAVSEEVSEPIVSDLMQAGAYDYVVKGNQERFARAVHRAMQCRINLRRAKEAEAEVRRLNHQLKIKYEVASICLSSAETDIYPRILDVLLRELGSEFGLFGYIDYYGDLVCPAVSPDIWERYGRDDKSVVFRREEWAGLWGRALLERRVQIGNAGLRVPDGHVPVERSVAAPLIYGERLIGLFMVANKATDYATEDAALLQDVAVHVAPIIAARIDAARHEFERHRTVVELQRSEERFRELFDNMVAGVIVYKQADSGDDFVIVSANRVAQEELSPVVGPLIGQRLSVLFPGVKEMGLVAVMSEVLRTGEARNLSAARYDDGTELSGWYDNIIYRLSSGEVVAVFENVTESVATQRALEDSELRYSLAVKGSNDGIWDWNVRTDEIYLAPQVKAFLGLDDRSFPSSLEAFEHHVLPEDRERVVSGLKEYLSSSSEDHFRMEFRMQHKSGGPRWLLMRGATVVGEDGLPVRMAGSISDITARKLAESAREKALRSSIERSTEFQSLLNCAQIVLDDNTFEVVAKRIFESAKAVIGATSGYVALLSEDGTENEVLFLDPGGAECRVDPSLPMPIRGLRERAYALRRAVKENDFMESDFNKLLPAGHVALGNVMFAPLNIAGKTVGVMGLANKRGGFTDQDCRVSEGFAELCALSLRDARQKASLKRHAEDLEAQVASRTAELTNALTQARQSRDRINAILHSMADGLMVTSLDGRVVLINEAAKEIVGLVAGESVGSKLDGPTVDATLREKVLRPLETKHPRYEFDIEREWDGSRAIYHASTSVYRTPEGEVAGVITIFSDVTRDREMERIKDEFLSTAAHELRTPLTSIRGFSELLLERADLADDERQRFLAHVRAQATHLASIVNDLLDLKRLERGIGFTVNPRSLRAADILTEIVGQLEITHADHRFTLQLPDRSIELLADPDKFEQAVRNVLSNALKYSARGSAISVGCAHRNGHIQVQVCDEGIGMTPAQLARVFDKFYRGDASSTAVEGTGLGLSIVKHIMDAHKGRVEIESEPGKGTRVQLLFPRGEAP